jgi:hypothetical protein
LLVAKNCIHSKVIANTYTMHFYKERLRVPDMTEVGFNSFKLSILVNGINSEMSVKQFRLVRFEVFTAVTMKNGVFRDVTPCGSCKNRWFGGT